MEGNVLKISYPTMAILIMIGLALLFMPEIGFAQDEEEDEGIFWGEEEDLGEFDEEEFLGEDEEFLGEDEEFLGEDEEFLDEESFDEADEYLYGEEEAEEAEQTGVELAEEARREGFTVQVSAASPGYVNNTLSNWNSGIDIRVSFDFPFLMQIGPIKFRLGAEVATFSFDNYLPIGGEFGGVGILGIVTFPAGPSSVQIGGGVMGSSPAFVVAQSFGLSVANVVDLRIGVRSTNAFNLPEEMNATGSRASWMDGFVTVGYTL